ncbi:MAG: hypothetical protein JO234_15105 [Hyphomicrobiales bacterium]|nr:hypothetical protein [Hyphomicrobiales bacterium]
MKVIITGESHTAALFMGQKQIVKEGKIPLQDILIRPLGGGHLLREPFFVDQGDHAEITQPELRRNYERLPLAAQAGERIVYGLCAPLHTARVWRETDWRSFAPLGHEVDETPVSPGMLRRVVLDDQRYVLDLIDIFARTKTEVFVIEAPRPFRHHPALKQIRPAVALAVDRAYRAAMRAELAARSVPIVSAPAATVDDKGFTREEFGRPDDPHHGNMRFGRLMMLEVDKFVAGLKSEHP